MDKFSRLEALIGKDNVKDLSKKHVAVFGIGGVGGYVVEALVRSGVGEISLIDNDVVDITNFNRQIIATNESLGKLKVDVMKQRVLSIKEDAIVHTYPMFFSGEKEKELPFDKFDYIVDAIDSVSSKIELIQLADKYNVKIISSMGTAKKMDPMGFIVADINKTEMDPLAKVIRLKLRKLGIKKLKVVYSKEQPIECDEKVLGSNAFVPSAAGLLIASAVIKDLINN